jgi:MEMO1 family protein
VGDVRRSAVAGTWYPGERELLAHAVDGYLAAVEPTGPNAPTRRPVAVISPHAGLMYSGPVAAYAYALAAAHPYASVVLVGPSHFVPFEGVAIWPRGSWETPLGPIAVDEELTSAIAAHARSVHEYPAAHAREHSLEMQLPFLARLMPGVRIAPMVMGHQSRATADALGHALAAAIAASDTAASVLLVASSDLSHYQDARDAGLLDRVIIDAVNAFDPDRLMTALERRPDHACGGGPMVAVLRAARQLGASCAQVLRYADSGDVSGDKSAVVGYMAAGIW